MDFIKPKNENKQKISLKVSYKTKLLIEYYSKYTDYSEDEVVDMFMQNLLKDANFVEWLKKRRSSKKISEHIFNKGNNSEEVF